MVSQDVLRRDVLKVPDVAGNPSVGLVDTVARYALDQGMHVVVEGILHAARYGPMLRALAANHVGTTRTYVFDVPVEETLRRHGTRPGAADRRAASTGDDERSDVDALESFTKAPRPRLGHGTSRRTATTAQPRRPSPARGSPGAAGTTPWR